MASHKGRRAHSSTSTIGDLSAEYQLQQLDPRSTDFSKNDGGLVDCMITPHRTSYTMHKELSSKFPSTRQDSLIGPFPKHRLKTLFAGPPPPIAASMIATEQSPNVSPCGYEAESRSRGLALDHMRVGYVSHHQRPVTVWRNLRRRERILEDNIQQLLDFQAAGLVSGRQLDRIGSRGDLDTHSDTGSTTPTEIFHSTQTSRSEMQRSLYLPPRSMLDGNVIPVRQPAKAHPPGLRAARNGLCTAIESLKELRREENEHIAAAMMQRKSALEQLNNLGRRRLGILSELTTFDNDGQEPLATELRELGERHNLVGEEISRLEEQLMELRKQQLWLRDKMRDIQGKREAGLSAYRGALRDVEMELSMLMKRPPVVPLDPAIQGGGDETLHRDLASAGGPEFLSLTLERRRPELAKTWWETELAVLEKRRMQVEKEEQALDEGSVLWRNVLSLVQNFETDLRQSVKGNPSKLDSSEKGKEKAYTEEECIRLQLANMGDVLTKLEQSMQMAESNGWNLLVCAIGAEQEAFREALDVLTSLLPREENKVSPSSTHPTPNSSRSAFSSHNDVNIDESDVDVPQDLLKSPADDSNPPSAGIATAANDTQYDEDECYNRPQSQGSENEVPVEFLAEHE
ncbi:hypothetical protein E4U41_000325 [Claviceps citrina]|nr:hypothetical protein E4U41_000325 [Claviceps citrina]